MDYEIIINEEAKHDLRNIFYYYAIQYQNNNYAMKIFNILINSINGLSFMPERYRLYDEQMYTDIDLRVMVVDKYNVFYYVDKIKNVVIIYHIFSNKSDIKAKLNLS